MAFQGPLGGKPPRTHREVFAEALKQAEREYREAQEAMKADNSDAARLRYARALYRYDRLQASFPFVAAGLADVRA